jgi:hypothetical protein
MKFKDKASGCIYEFLLDHDVKQMLAHPDYEEVKEEVKPVKQTKKAE